MRQGHISGTRIPGPEFTSKAFRNRNREMIKQPKASIATALAAHDRIQAISDEIRGRHGLPLVPEAPRVMAWRAKVGPVKVQSLAERAAALAASRAKLERDRVKVDRELAALAEEARGTREVTRIADLLGLSRQRLYQLAA